ncbi:MAG: hypothetical protein PUF48_03470 [Oscillospiraceae bacterium]|nr:hypothetical protein [Oscillospiraceae bacterium]
MGIFSKKTNDELFKLIEESDNNSTFDINEEDQKVQPSHAITVDEVLLETDASPKADNTPKLSPLEALKNRVINNAHHTEIEKKESREAPSLLEKCKPYIVDENGNDATTPKEPLYRLESVAEILENDSRSTLDRLAEKYDIMIDDLKTGTPVVVKDFSSNKVETEVETSDPIGIKLDSIQTSLPDISDIDTFVTKNADDNAPEVSDATIRFTPIGDKDSKEGMVTVLSTTNTIDLTNEIADLILPETATEETKLEETEFDSFKVDEEYKSPSDTKHLLYSLSVKRRNSFLRMIASGFLTVLLLFFEIPPASDLMLSNTKAMMIVCSVILGLGVIANIDMFLSFKNIFGKKSTPDITAALASIGTLTFSIVSALNSYVGYELVLLCSLILSFRAIAQFLSRASVLGNLKQITSHTEKKAISLITDEATTFAMAKNAIEGDVLIATPRKTENVTDFMKYTKFGLFMKGKLSIITIISIVLSIISGFAAMSIFGEAVKAFYSAAAVLCMAALPTVFLIEAMPLHSSAKKLNIKGSMIAGKTAAERLEMANAVVLTSSDLFPSGSVTLHNMKVLSDNNIDDTIMKAASLTDAVNSPLSPIFKQIAKTNSAYSIPDSDTVKYEERLGLSGWVDDEPIFIGNRTLMEAHGIEVPDVKVDKQILERGFFPVYIASGNKASALIVIQYSANPEVVYELRKITDAGVTLIINNCDPNLTNEMICDYLDLYEDSVKVMSNAGVHMYKNACTPTEECSAPAVFRGKPLNFITVMNTAARIKKSILFLGVLYLLAMCIGMVIFAYTSFSGGDAPLSSQTLLLYELGATALSLLFYQIFKP